MNSKMSFFASFHLGFVGYCFDDVLLNGGFFHLTVCWFFKWCVLLSDACRLSVVSYLLPG